MIHTDFTNIRLDITAGVATLTLDRPDQGNAIDLAMARELLEAATICDQDSTLRLVVLQAAGRFFCAGGDVRAFAAAETQLPGMVSLVTAALHGAIARLMRMEKPLLTVVQGAAAGAGLGLAVMGDIVLASENASFSFAYNGIGLSPDGGTSWLVPRLIGLRRAQELAFAGSRLGAAEAMAAGLITRALPEADLAGAVADWRARLANGPTRAFAQQRSLFLQSHGSSLEAHLEDEARGIARLCASADGREGIAAFIAKRRPDFAGS